MQPVFIREPVAAEQPAGHRVALRAAGFGSRQRAQRDVAVDVAVVEVAAAERRAGVPRAVAPADVDGAGRLVELEAGAAVVALVLRVAGHHARDQVRGELDVAADEDGVEVRVAVGHETAVEVLARIVVRGPGLELAHRAGVDRREHPAVERAPVRLLGGERRLGEHADLLRGEDDRSGVLRRGSRGPRSSGGRRRQRSRCSARSATPASTDVQSERRRRRLQAVRGHVREAEGARIRDDLVQQTADALRRIAGPAGVDSVENSVVLNESGQRGERSRLRVAGERGGRSRCRARFQTMM